MSITHIKNSVKINASILSEMHVLEWPSDYDSGSRGGSGGSDGIEI